MLRQKSERAKEVILPHCELLKTTSCENKNLDVFKQTAKRSLNRLRNLSEAGHSAMHYVWRLPARGKYHGCHGPGSTNDFISIGRLMSLSRVVSRVSDTSSQGCSFEGDSDVDLEHTSTRLALHSRRT
jgi:hypothetical protein